MKLSIVTSTWNTQPAYLTQAYQSILQQQGSTPWTWFVRDDGSATAWTGIVDDRIVYTQGDHLGRGASMKILMSDPRLTDWIVHLDADDWLEPNALESVVAASEANPDTAMFYSNHWAHRRTGTSDGILQPSIAEDMLNGRRPYHLIVMNKAAYQRTEGYSPDFPYSSDFDVWLKLQEVGPLRHIPKQLYHWREHSAQMFANYLDEQIFYSYKAVKNACIRRSSHLKPNLRWDLILK
ncbi:MAG: glycosyltransferase [Plesiomonas shigelloides]